MENVSNRLELLTANDGHAVISVQTTRRQVARRACRRHQRPPGLWHSSCMLSATVCGLHVCRA